MARTSPAQTRSSRPSTTRPAARSTRSGATPRRRSTRSWSIQWHIVRLVVGYMLVLLGVMLFIGLAFRGGKLTDYEWNLIAPWFGSVRNLLPVAVLVSGYELIQSHVRSRDWQLTVVGSFLAFFA